MTNWPPLRAGTPKLSAAGAGREVTMPSLKISFVDAGVGDARDVAAAADKKGTTRWIPAKKLMIFSPRWPGGESARSSARVVPASAVKAASLGGLSRRVYGCHRSESLTALLWPVRRPWAVDGASLHVLVSIVENGHRAGPARR